MEVQPKKVEFYIYAENDDDIHELALALYELVHDYHQEGIIVTAPKVTEAIRKWKNNFFVKNFLK